MHGYKLTSPNNKLLFLTFVAVFVEIVSCIWGLMNISSIWPVPLLLGSYHLGYVTARYRLFRKGGYWNAFILTLATIIVVFGIYKVYWPLLLIGFPLLSSAIQGTRRILKGQSKLRSNKKNASKLLAMIASSIVILSRLPVVLILASFLIIAIYICAGTRGKVEIFEIKNDERQNKILLWFEFLHHAHYFAYCYTFWYLLPQYWHTYIGFLFPIGWLGYWVLEVLLRESTKYFDKRVLAIGHLLNAVAIIAIASYGGGIFIIAMWFVTGVGGGTAYMLSNVTPAGDREYFEDMGHLIGCLIASLLILITNSVKSSLWVGAVLAILGALILLMWKQPITSNQLDQSKV